ncbi:hypothetical protein ES703_99300 [subsurface metagenome]
MNKITRIVLKLGFVVVGVCVPFIVINSITRDGNWGMLLYLVWAAAIELVILMLLSKKTCV